MGPHPANEAAVRLRGAHPGPPREGQLSGAQERGHHLEKMPAPTLLGLTANLNPKGQLGWLNKYHT